MKRDIVRTNDVLKDDREVELCVNVDFTAIVIPLRNPPKQIGARTAYSDDCKRDTMYTNKQKRRQKGIRCCSNFESNPMLDIYFFCINLRHSLAARCGEIRFSLKRGETNRKGKIGST